MINNLKNQVGTVIDLRSMNACALKFYETFSPGGINERTSVLLPKYPACACDPILQKEEENQNKKQNPVINVAMERLIGKVKWFDNAKGFGFIVAADGKDIFVHYEDIKMQGFAQLSSNQQVEYSVRKSDKGLKAFDVVPIVEEDA